MATFLDRYLAGEHEAVWRDLTALGDRALLPDVLPDARAVARETVSRALRNLVAILRKAVASGAVDCALALGFEQMKPGALGAQFADRVSPFERFDNETEALVGHAEIPLALRYFGGAGLAYMQQHGTPLETFAKVRAKEKAIMDGKFSVKVDDSQPKATVK